MLQNQIFPKMSHVRYFGPSLKRIGATNRPFRGWPDAQSLSFPFSLSPAFWADHGESYLGMLLNQPFDNISGDNSQRTTVILSDENIFLGRGFFRSRAKHPHPLERKDPNLLGEHLSKIGDIVHAQGFSRLKVILCIRRQDTWLASRYAQSSAFIHNAGQCDFERQVGDVLRPEGRRYTVGVWLDYAHVYGTLSRAVGQENLLVVPMEWLEMDSNRLIDEVLSFTQPTQPNDSLLTVHHVAAENVRRTGSDRWPLRTRQVALALPKPVDRLGLKKLKFRIPRVSRRHIVLNQRLTNQILEEYAAANNRLQSRTGLELSSLGYTAER